MAETCYRHPGRETNVSCSNCGRPICPDCMTSTPVGMRCPECARERTRVRAGVGGGRGGGRSEAPTTYALIVLCVAAFVAELAGGGAATLEGSGRVVAEGGLVGFAIDQGQAVGVAEGEWYRIITSAFLHAGIFHLALNMFALYILGMLLEPAIGTLRFLGLYAVSVLGGAFGALLLDPHQLTIGASGGVFGLMAAGFLIARRRGFDEIATQIGFFVVLNLVFTFSVPNISIGGHLGGLAGGGLAALLYSALEQRRVPNAGFAEAAAILGLAVVAAAGALIAAYDSAPPTLPVGLG